MACMALGEMTDNDGNEGVDEVLSPLHRSCGHKTPTWLRFWSGCREHTSSASSPTTKAQLEQWDTLEKGVLYIGGGLPQKQQHCSSWLRTQFGGRSTSHITCQTPPHYMG
ncbi:hypothetical protein SKAU_G00211750 [Synaphobranchus kaupii]|uniref:Uncharacterized protein n=1 Tax=Synaphobranchus kaupii TaxID=118154 RepID=A0A9Q1F9G9_SYNKA|nr:hypothetical protein SKAU_G00211750 [Synaphobranchus kaupii]